ncbi:MAG: ferritin-like domain-containing protein [Gemmatimonadota bacterium]|nr:ferritin-like domain-containing protein [Gemmatimonadota bacterium]
MPSLHDALIDQLKDLYSAENQIAEALPKMIDAAHSDELRKAFEGHLEETRGQIDRLEEVFEKLSASPGGKKCKGMEGLLKEGEETIEEHSAGPTRDALLIASAQRVEHYEIAVYGTVAEWADAMDYDDVADLLGSTLDEEEDADEKLTSIAEGGLLEDGVNEAAMADD